MTLEQCVAAVGSIALIDENGDWIFLAGYKTFRGNSGDYASYEIYVQQKNERAVSAVLRARK